MSGISMGDLTPEEDARTESQRLLLLAEEFTQSYPSSEPCEIAVTGSVSRGLADPHSDVEIIVWCDEMPAERERHHWLRHAGARDIVMFPDWEQDGSVWSTCLFGGRWVEMGWNRFGPVEHMVGELACGRAYSHTDQGLAALLCDAIPLRTDGRLAAWKERLRHYPDEVQRQTILANTRVWADGHVPPVRLALAERGALMPLAMRLLWDMQNVWSVLFAINRTWEPDYKWTTAAALHLPIMPSRFPERLNAVFRLAEPERSVREAFALILEVLDLVPAAYDVSRARASVAQAAGYDGRKGGDHGG